MQPSLFLHGIINIHGIDFTALNWANEIEDLEPEGQYDNSAP
jgi:hypothetical protein